MIKPAKTKREELLEAILGVIFIFVFMPILILVNTLIVQLLWGWFIKPGFGVEVPGFWILYGSMLTIRFAFFNTDSEDREAKEKIKNMDLGDIIKLVLKKAFVSWASVLIFAFVAHLFV